VNLPVNLGIGGAVQTGYRYAFENGYDLALQVDGDGQHNPQFLHEMIAYLISHNADMVIGSRFIKKEGFQSSWLRRIGIGYFTWLIKLCTGKTITDPTSGFRVVGKKVIKLFADSYPKDYPEPETIVMVLNQNCKIEEIPVIMRERQGGVSSITIMKSIHYMIKETYAILKQTLKGKQHEFV
jgi:glycosyltransferase involved in cell wall biosynthesis